MALSDKDSNAKPLQNTNYPIKHVNWLIDLFMGLSPLSGPNTTIFNFFSKFNQFSNVFLQGDGSPPGFPGGGPRDGSPPSKVLRIIKLAAISAERPNNFEKMYRYLLL